MPTHTVTMVESDSCDNDDAQPTIIMDPAITPAQKKQRRRYYSLKTMSMSVTDQVQPMEDSAAKISEMKAKREDRVEKSKRALEEILLLMQAEKKVCCKRKNCSSKISIELALEINEKASWMSQIDKRVFVIQNILGDKYFIGSVQVCEKYFRMVMDCSTSLLKSARMQHIERLPHVRVSPITNHMQFF